MNKQQFLEIIDRYLDGKATLQEEQLLLNYMGSFQQRQQWPEGLPDDKAAIGARVLNKIKLSAVSEKEAIPPVHLLRRNWFRYAAAVFVLAVAGIFIYFFIPEHPADNTVKTVPADIQPGGNKAVLTLDNGTVVILDSAASGSLAQQGNTKIIKLNAGSLAYNAGMGQPANGKVLYNSIRTPKGGQYQVILEDGSKVWLNAESSVRFPVAFSGNARTVSITGEVYMEIAPDPTKPFSVKIGEGNAIDVLGTSFNINAYADESVISTTLITGSVRVHAGQQVRILKPGQQSQVTPNGPIQLVHNAGIAEAIAWKEGLFSFTDADLPAVMRQLSRWYNLDIVYAGKIPHRAFNGEIGRSLTLMQVMNLLGKTRVNYKIENGNKIIIYP